MTLPSNFRSLVAFGIFCVVAGAWLTLVTEVRARPLVAGWIAKSCASALDTHACGDLP
jgi:hypothetical protein